MDDIKFDIHLLISLLEARTVFWDKTDDSYKDRNETKMHGQKFAFVFKKSSKPWEMIKTTFLLSIAIIYRTQLIEIHTNKFYCLILCTLMFIFLTCQEAAPTSVRK